MRQLVYISTISPVAMVDPDAILSVSRRNNRRDGISGALWFDGKRFLQALEGDAAKVDAAFERIREDARHRAVVVLSDRAIGQREFGDWAMAYRVSGSGADDDGAVARIEALVAGASVEVRATFESFARIRRAA